MNHLPARGYHLPMNAGPEGQPSAHHHKHSQSHDKVPFGLVPGHVGYGGTPEFIYLTLSGLNMLSDQSSVQQYTRARPDAHRAILDLSGKVAKAGIRVRDTHRNAVIDDHLRSFSAEEIWMFDLAIDVLAMLGTSGGQRGTTHSFVLDRLRSLAKDHHVRGLYWKAEVHKAGDGPAEFRELRAQIPHHKLHG